MITIARYTAAFDPAMSHGNHIRPRVGSMVRVDIQHDDREMHAFEACLRAHDLDLVFERHMPRAKADVFRVSRAAK